MSVQERRRGAWGLRRGVGASGTILAGILAAATLLRLFQLGEQSFWLDEAFAARLARLDWRASLASEINATLYYRLLRVWMLFGDSEAVLRGFSVLWSVATIPVLYALGRRLLTPREGLVAAALLAVNAFHIAYAQEARAYSLMVFLVTLAALCFVKALEQWSVRYWVTYALVTVAAILTHVIAVLAPIAHLAALVFLPPRDVPWRRVAGAMGAIGVVGLLWGVVIAVRGGYNVSFPELGLRNVYAVFMALSGQGGLPLLVAYTGAVVLSVARAVHTWTSSDRSSASFRYGFLLAWLVVPVSVAYTVTESRLLYLPRFLIFCVPPLALLAAAGVASLRPFVVRAAALFVMVGLALGGVCGYYSRFKKEEWRLASRIVLCQAKSGDALLFHASYVRVPFDYYRERAAGVEQSPSISVASGPADVSSRTPRVWLIVSHDMSPEHRESRSIAAALAHGRPFALWWRLFGIDVVLFSARPVQPSACAPPPSASVRGEGRRSWAYSRENSGVLP